MRGPKFKMKSLLTICVLLISTSAIAHAQQKTVGSKQKAVGRSETRLSHTSLTRAQTKEDAVGIDRFPEMGGPTYY